MAGRREKVRSVGLVPEYVAFRPEGLGAADDPGVTITLDELEALRLIDLEGLSQQEAAGRMGVARATVAAIYGRVRAKVADALVNGRRITVAGGNVAYRPEALARAAWPPKERGDMMRVAVTYENGEVFQHFGRTRQFKLYDVEDGRVASSQVVDAGGAGHGALAGLLAQNQVDKLVCGGLGGGALAALAQAGIEVYAGASGPADEAVAAFLAGAMQPANSATCDHHDHGHACYGHAEGEGCREAGDCHAQGAVGGAPAQASAQGSQPAVGAGGQLEWWTAE